MWWQSRAIVSYILAWARHGSRRIQAKASISPPILEVSLDPCSIIQPRLRVTSLLVDQTTSPAAQQPAIERRNSEGWPKARVCRVGCIAELVLASLELTCSFAKPLAIMKYVGAGR